MSKIREILRKKSGDVWQIGPDASVYEALELMAEKDIGALPVTSGGQVVGLFSERDYARNVVLKGKSSRDTLVRELMNTPVLNIGPDRTVDECMAIMTEKRVRHLPVLDGDALIGMITIGDVVKQVISDQDYTIDFLEQYIHGT